MLHDLGVFIARHRLIVVLAWIAVLAGFLATAVGGVAGDTLFDRLSSAGPTVEGEASEADELLQPADEDPTESLTLLLHDVALPGAEAADAGLTGILSDASADLRDLDGVSEVINPLEIPPLPDGTPNPAAAALFAEDGRGLLLSVAMTTSQGELGDDVLRPVQDRLETAAAEVRAASPEATVEVGGGPLLVESLVAVAETDLQRGELISLPIALLVMLLIFGGFLAAGIPVIGAIASIAGALGSLYGFSYLMDIDTTVLNVITVIGLGLSIDYGLLIVSRFREEFRALVRDSEEHAASAAREPADARGGTARRDKLARRARHELMLQAVGATVDTAGRTVLFSGLTFAIATVGLLVFEPTIIRAISVGAVSVVLIAILTALVLVPALLGYFGERLLQPGLLTRVPGLGALLTRFGDVAPQEGFFSSLTRGVQRAPALVALIGTAALLLLGSPVLGMNVANSGLDAIPKSSSQYGFVTTLNGEFPLATASKVQLVSSTDESSAAAWAKQVSGLPNVTAVSAPIEVSDHWVSRVSVDRHEGAAVVREIRADRPDFDHWVGGTDAASVDYTDSLLEGAPAAALIITISTFLLLFLMTGSVVIPLTALFISTVSLGASVGVLVWGFQEGNLAGALNFDPATVAGVDPLVLTLVLTFGFGLAMDYEMFLLSRIKEHHDQGESTRRAIETGLQSSGRIITSAGLIIVLVFAGFATGDLIQLKQIGIALAVAVLLDATLVRAVLVPSVMTALEPVLWWAPRWLRPLHARFGLRD